MSHTNVMALTMCGFTLLVVYSDGLSNLLVQDTSTAKTLAFNKEVRTRCITLEGDDFNPGGTLTGKAHIWNVCSTVSLTSLISTWGNIKLAWI